VKTAAPRRRELSTFKVFDFRKGWDIKLAPLTQSLTRGQNSLRRADNAVYTESGGVSSLRPALQRQAGVTGVRITGGAQYRKSDNTHHIIVGTEAGTILRADPGQTTYTTLLSGLSTYTRFYFAQYGDTLLICNRVDAPRVYDGTSVTTLGGSPPGTGGPVAIHGNRAFMLDATQPTRLSWSELNNVADWTSGGAGSVFVSENDGYKAINLVAGVNELIVIKENRPFRLQGTSPSDFAITNLVPTTGSVGGVSHAGAVFAGNDVFYLSRNGIVSVSTVLNFGDLKAKFASDRIGPLFALGARVGSGASIGIGTGLNARETPFSIASMHLDQAIAVYDASHNRLLFAIDGNGDRLPDTILVYDLVLGAWSRWIPPRITALGSAVEHITAMWSVLDAQTDRNEIWIAHASNITDDSIVYAVDHWAGGTKIFLVLNAEHLSDLGLPGWDKTLRYGFFYFREAGSHTATVATRLDGEQVASKTYSVSMLGASKTLGVNWTLGTDVLGAREQITKRVDLSGTAEYVGVRVNGTLEGIQPLYSWYGYELAFRRRRQVRRGV